MKKIFAIILSLVLLTLCACSGDNSVSENASVNESSNVASEVASPEDGKELPKNESDEDSEQSNTVSKTTEPRALEKITVEHGVYEFFEDRVGEYQTEFDTVKNEENGNLTLILKDGRSVELVYGDILYDEEDEIYKTTINGLSFWIEDITDSEGRMLQILECIERPERSIFVQYYPELDCGDMRIFFDYEANGTEYTFKYADGNTSVKTILYNEETEEYYFG